MIPKSTLKPLLLRVAVAFLGILIVIGSLATASVSPASNHWGTIILAEPLELPDDGRRYIDEETDWSYDPFRGAEKNQKPCATVGEFMNQYLNR